MKSIKLFTTNKTIFLFWILAIVSFGIRLYISFSHDLMIGNGGYYPLQVRTVLERGELAFNDMPFLFYWDAGLIKIISFMGIAITDSLIFGVVQFVDSLSIVLMLFPLYKFLKLTKNHQFSYFQMLIMVYAVLTFYTLNMITTSQKNSLAITFLVFFSYYLIKYLTTIATKKTLLLAIIFLLLTGLTHFGTFIYALIFCMICILYRFKTKALIPIAMLLVTGLALIYFFDVARFQRVFSIGEELLVRLPNPPQIIKIILYGTLALLAIKGLKKYRNDFTEAEIIIIKTLITILIVIPLPIINPQFTDRLTTFLFIPQVFLLLYFSPYLAIKIKHVFSVFIGIVSLASILLTLLFSHPEGLNKQIIKDMEMLESVIPNPSNTVIISRHNLEFWVAYKLHVAVAQESKFDKTLVNNYDYVYIINQTNGLRMDHKPPSNNGKKSHFEEPTIPEKAELVITTEYFKLYQYK